MTPNPPCPRCERPLGLAETNYGLGSRRGHVIYWFCAVCNLRVDA